MNGSVTFGFQILSLGTGPCSQTSKSSFNQTTAVCTTPFGLRKPWSVHGVPTMSERKVSPTDFAAEIERLKPAGKLPTLEEVLDAVAETREKYAPKILKAREEGS